MKKLITLEFSTRLYTFFQKLRLFFHRQTGSTGNNVGKSWTRISGGLKQIDSGPYGVVYGVNKNNDIFCRTGISNYNPKGTGWQHIGGKLKYISCGDVGCWGVNAKDQIFFRKGVSPTRPTGTLQTMSLSLKITIAGSLE